MGVIAAAKPPREPRSAPHTSGLAALTGALEPVGSVLAGGGPLLQRLAFANLFLAVFNLIPAFPMDGRMLRALLAMRMDYTRATQIAAAVGQGFAILLGLVGLLWNPMLLFIALFVWIGAAQKSSMAQVKGALGGIPVQRVMIREFRTLSPSDPLDRAVSLMLDGWQPDFPVVDAGRVTGVLRKDDLLRALGRGNTQALVGDVMHREVERVDSFEMLDGAVAHMTSGGSTTLPVVQDGKLVGVLTTENIGEFLSIQAALGGRRSPIHTSTAGARVTVRRSAG